MLVTNDTTITLLEDQDASVSLLPSLFTELGSTTEVGIGFTFYETAVLFPLPESSPSNLTIGSAVIGALVSGQSFSNLHDPVTIFLHLTLPVCFIVFTGIFKLRNFSLHVLLMQPLNPRCASWDFTAAGKFLLWLVLVLHATILPWFVYTIYYEAVQP